MNKFGVVCAFILILALFYVGSLWVAYNKGYEKHRFEIMEESAKVVINSQKDIITAGEKVKKTESKIEKKKQNDKNCDYIMSLDISNCVPK